MLRWIWGGVRGPLLAWLMLLIVKSASAAPITILDVSAAGFVGQAKQGPLDQPVRLFSYQEFRGIFGESTVGLSDPYLAPSVAAYFANGVTQLWIVRTQGGDDASLIGVDGGAPGARTGLQAFLDVPHVYALAIPGVTTPAVQAALIAHCQAKGDRLAILDPASTNDPNAVMAQRSGLAAPDGHATLYFPWVQAAPAGVSLLLPPSPFVAGLYGHTPPPNPPTGPVITASGLSYNVSSTLQGTLNPLGIDVLRYFSAQGFLVYGARTLASNPDWQYVSVRRMGFDVEASIREGTAWAATQPNDVALWTQLRADVNDFMYTLFVAGWFQGATPSQAYFVRCDATTMTAEDLAAGRTVILVGFAPLRPAEFIVMRIVVQHVATTGVGGGDPHLAFAAPYPDPVRERTAFAGELAQAETVTLRIHDVAGRIVRTLARRQSLGAGRHVWTWDARDDTGARVAPGLYLARFEAGGRVLTRQVVVLD